MHLPEDARFMAVSAGCIALRRGIGYRSIVVAKSAESGAGSIYISVARLAKEERVKSRRLDRVVPNVHEFIYYLGKTCCLQQDMIILVLFVSKNESVYSDIGS